MANQKKINSKTNQRKIKFLAGIILLISCCIVFTLIIILKPIIKPAYEIESKIEEIEKSKKNDTSQYKTIGWLKVQGTNIDLPVLGFQALWYAQDVEIGNFVWNFDNEETFTNKINIMGHNILNLSSNPEINRDYFTRFDDLMAFVYYDFAKENKYIQYTVDGTDYLYKIFSVNFESMDEVKNYSTGNYSKKKLKNLINRYKKTSFYNYDIDVNENDDIITLMTCTRFFGPSKKVAFIVNGRVVREHEMIDDYKVEKSNNYKKIEKQMKGDEDNEEV